MLMHHKNVIKISRHSLISIQSGIRILSKSLIKNIQGMLKFFVLAWQSNETIKVVQEYADKLSLFNGCLKDYQSRSSYDSKFQRQHCFDWKSIDMIQDCLNSVDQYPPDSFGPQSLTNTSQKSISFSSSLINANTKTNYIKQYKWHVPHLLKSLFVGIHPQISYLYYFCLFIKQNEDLILLKLLQTPQFYHLNKQFLLIIDCKEISMMFCPVLGIELTYRPITIFQKSFYEITLLKLKKMRVLPLYKSKNRIQGLKSAKARIINCLFNFRIYLICKTSTKLFSSEFI